MNCLDSGASIGEVKKESSMVGSGAYRPSQFV